jgi:hypothetical protein
MASHARFALEGGAVNDTKVGCTVCGRQQSTSFGGSLCSGWPKCCGYTMRLMRTEADIEAVTATVVRLQSGGQR